MPKHGGLAEILRTGQCPGLRTADTFRRQRSDVRVPGVPMPRGGWQDEQHLNRALKSRGLAPEALESEFVRNCNRSLKEPAKRR